jgi:3-oxoacyl-[acyl-carrier-protein] synthase II
MNNPGEVGMIMRRRVVITGLGVVTPIGVGIEDYWTASLSGKSGVREITSFDASSYPTRIAGEVKHNAFDLKDYVEHGDPVEAMGKSVQFGIASAQMAVSDCCINVERMDPARAGVSMGVTEELDYHIRNVSGAAFSSAYGEAGQKKRDLEKYVAQYGKTERARTGFVSYLPGFVTTKIASTYGLQGPCCSVNTACAAGSQAIGDACRIIEWGDADFMIAGGTESLGGPTVLLMFILLNAISTNNGEPEKASRPFDARRDGFVLGEGAGILVLESLEHALRRDARIYAEIIGFGASCDAYRVTDEPPDGRGAIQSMRNALADAGIAPEDVDYINAHGTSTQMNDKVETVAIKEVFGEHACKIPISSSKSMIGHLLAGAGAVELVTCLLAMRDGILPPTINYEYLDPECDLDYVPNESREADVKVALSNSFGFGGQNTSIVVKRMTEKLDEVGGHP